MGRENTTIPLLAHLFCWKSLRVVALGFDMQPSVSLGIAQGGSMGFRHATFSFVRNPSSG